MSNDLNNDRMGVVKVFSASPIKVLRAFCSNLYFKEPALGVNSNV